MPAALLRFPSCRSMLQITLLLEVGPPHYRLVPRNAGQSLVTTAVSRVGLTLSAPMQDGSRQLRQLLLPWQDLCCGQAVRLALPLTKGVRTC